MRRAVLVVLVAAMLVIAGCAGGPNANDTAENETPENASGDENADETATESDETTDTSTGEENESTGDDDSTDEDSTDEDDSAGDESDTGDETDTVETGGDGELAVHYIDVGQADATLVEFPNGETMLIDSGDWRDDGEDVIDFLESRGVDRIDHLVATHAHADHIGGHEAVIDHFEENGDGVGAAYDSGVVHTSSTYERYLDAIERHDVALYEVQEGDELSIGEATVELYNPPAGDSGSDLHENSVSFTVEYGETAFLFTGDAESDVESRLVESRGDDLAADVYQAGHHGSSTSSSDAFLDRVDPETAVISSDEDSQYGHPHDEVLESFADRGIETYWTAVHGTIVVTSDGESLSVTPEVDATTDPAELLEEKSNAAALSHPVWGASSRGGSTAIAG